MEKFSETMHVNTWYRTTPSFQDLKYDPRVSKRQRRVCPYFCGWRFSEEKLWQKAEMLLKAKVPLEWQKSECLYCWKGRGWLPDGGETAGAFRGNEQWQNYVGWRPNWTKYHLVDALRSSASGKGRERNTPHPPPLTQKPCYRSLRVFPYWGMGTTSHLKGNKKLFNLGSCTFKVPNGSQTWAQLTMAVWHRGSGQSLPSRAWIWISAPAMERPLQLWKLNLMMNRKHTVHCMRPSKSAEVEVLRKVRFLCLEHQLIWGALCLSHSLKYYSQYFPLV